MLHRLIEFTTELSHRNLREQRCCMAATRPKGVVATVGSRWAIPMTAMGRTGDIAARGGERALSTHSRLTVLRASLAIGLLAIQNDHNFVDRG